VDGGLNLISAAVEHSGLRILSNQLWDAFPETSAGLFLFPYRVWRLAVISLEGMLPLLMSVVAFRRRGDRPSDGILPVHFGAQGPVPTAYGGSDWLFNVSSEEMWSSGRDPFFTSSTYEAWPLLLNRRFLPQDGLLDLRALS